MSVLTPDRHQEFRDYVESAFRHEQQRPKPKPKSIQSNRKEARKRRKR
jgi:hypothetical protein